MTFAGKHPITAIGVNSQILIQVYYLNYQGCDISEVEYGIDYNSKLV